MSVGIIDGGREAVLWCDTDYRALPPVFASGEHAQDFLDWLRAVTTTTGLAVPDELAWLVGCSHDPRDLDPRDLRAAVEAWEKVRTDSDGALLPC